MHRVRMLIHFGVKPFLVFDGDYLPSKSATEKERAARRRESKRLGFELLGLGKASEAYIELQKAIDVTPEMAGQLIEELKHADVEYVVAPYEADSQLAYLEKKGHIDAILSEDSDLLVFGAQCLLTKLDQYGGCVMIKRADFTACREVSLTGWSDADFRRMAILSGCDYLPSISKMGLKTAHRLLRKHKTVERALKAVQFDGQFKVPVGYLEAFHRAEMTFLYQWVFCPEAQQVVNFTTPEDLDVGSLPYIGNKIEAKLASQVATGALHPHTKEPLKVTMIREPGFRTPAHGWKKTSAASSSKPKDMKPIASFFKSKRTPLAELDPNSFAQSVSQQDLLERQTTSWMAEGAPSRPTFSRVRTSPPSTEHRPTTMESFHVGLSRSSALGSSKRRWLCAKTASVVGDVTTKSTETTSPFFVRSGIGSSPSITRRATESRVKRAGFEVWSDDCIAEATVDLSDEEITLPMKKKKLTVFADDQRAHNKEISAPVEELDRGEEYYQASPTCFLRASASSVSRDSGYGSAASTPSASFEAMIAERRTNLSLGTSQLRERIDAETSALRSKTMTSRRMLHFGIESSGPLIGRSQSEIEIHGELSPCFEAQKQETSACKTSFNYPDSQQDASATEAIDVYRQNITNCEQLEFPETSVLCSSPPQYSSCSPTAKCDEQPAGPPSPLMPPLRELKTSLKGSEDLIVPCSDEPEIDDSEASGNEDAAVLTRSVLDLQRYAYRA